MSDSVKRLRERRSQARIELSAAIHRALEGGPLDGTELRKRLGPDVEPKFLQNTLTAMKARGEIQYGLERRWRRTDGAAPAPPAAARSTPGLSPPPAAPRQSMPPPSRLVGKTREAPARTPSPAAASNGAAKPEHEVPEEPAATAPPPVDDDPGKASAPPPDPDPRDRPERSPPVASLKAPLPEQLERLQAEVESLRNDLAVVISAAAGRAPVAPALGVELAPGHDVVLTFRADLRLGAEELARIGDENGGELLRAMAIIIRVEQDLNAMEGTA